jgi:FtsP/CotA-like multicopper oxidase with cupredoxin domain
VLLAAAIAVGVLVSATYVSDLGRNKTALPPGCTKPADGFLIIAGDSPGNVGYNDSAGHGAPTNPWPIIRVQKGTTVNITVCNTDTQAHGFNISHYYDSSIETVAPGQVIRVQFVASETGTFGIYCAIFCTIHVFMQSGELIVE